MEAANDNFESEDVFLLSKADEIMTRLGKKEKCKLQRDLPLLDDPRKTTLRTLP